MLRRSPIALLAASLAAAPALAAPPRPAVPWATVNVCDTAARPDELGIRGSMPGLARRARMAMRFRVEFRDGRGRWRPVRSGADSGWVRLGAGRGGVRDAGWSFAFQPPASGGAYVLRGVVAFEWRRGGRVVRRTRRVTRAGHPGTAGADPPGYSAATCEIA